ncbi:MAG: acylphosphatase [Syntrophobacteraceae bacterium]
MKKRRVHVWIKGRVQGVVFRAYTRDMAQLTGVSGWVRNLPDGRVEAVFEGDDENVEKMVAWCHEGSPFGHVDSVEVREEVYGADFEQFRITR